MVLYGIVKGEALNALAAALKFPLSMTGNNGNWLVIIGQVKIHLKKSIHYLFKALRLKTQKNKWGGKG